MSRKPVDPLLRTFLVSYLPGALFLGLVVTGCELLTGLSLDSWDETFINGTSQDVVVTPLYTTADGAERVVPRSGWTQTEFALPAGSSRTIELETGDFPLHRVLVESANGRAWMVPVRQVPIEIAESGVPASAAQLAAKQGPRLRRLCVYAVGFLIPLIWALPAVLLHRLALWRKARRRAA